MTEELPRLDEIPFDSERKLMTTLHQENDGFIAFSKGAPESLLPKCATQWADAGLQAVNRDAIMAMAE